MNFMQILDEANICKRRQEPETRKRQVVSCEWSLMQSVVGYGVFWGKARLALTVG